MSVKQHWMGAAAALALCAFAAPAMAAPISGGNELKASAANAGVEKAAYRRCWWNRGRQVCRWYGDDYGYYPSYGYPSYGYGPGVNFYFGGGGRGHGHHGGHRGGGHGGHGHR